MKRYTFEIEEERSPFRKLRIEAPESATLADLALRLQAGLEFPAEEGWSFFRSGRAHDEDTEFGSEYRAARDAAKAVLGRLALRENARLAYQHGEGYDHVVKLRVVAVGEGDGAWKAPPVPPAPPSKRPSYAQRARTMLFRSDRAGELDADARRALRREEIALAKELLDVPSGPQDFGELSKRMPLEEWLGRLPYLAAEAGLVKEALAFALWLATACGRIEAMAARAAILARFGRKKSARKLVDDCIDDFPDEPEFLRLLARACLGMDDVERAERCLRTAIAHKGRDARVQRENALAELNDLLRAQGRAEEGEAAARIAKEAEECFDPEPEDELFDRDEDDDGPPPPREMVLVRRTDPCPCGSGKKHMDCCYDVPPDEELEWELLCDVLDPLMDEVIAEDPALFAAEFTRCGGPAFEGLSFPEISPLLPDFQAEWVYMHWFTLDRGVPEGGQAAILRRMELHPEIRERERELLRRVARTTLGLYHVRSARDSHRIDVKDLIEGTKFRSETGASILFYGASQVVLARFIHIDGEMAPVAHILFVREDHEDATIDLARERWTAFVRAYPELEGDARRKAFAPELIRAWFDALHLAPAE